MLSGKTIRPPQNLRKGQYFEVCYIKQISGDLIKIPLGIIYIQKPIQYVYPFNRGVNFKKPTTFSGSGGDVGPGDELVFSSAKDCSLIDAPGTSYNKVIFTRKADSNYTTT